MTRLKRMTWVARLLAALGILLGVYGCPSWETLEASAARLDQPGIPTGFTRALPVEMREIVSLDVAHWAERGISFEGSWQQEETDLVIGVLNRFADRLGEDRLLALARQAVADGTDGERQSLTFYRDREAEGWVGTWTPQSGRITIYESLFDQAYMEDHYPWRFERAIERAAPGSVTDQALIVGHELGHMLLDGLRSEQIAEGLAPTHLEDAYDEALTRELWAHPFHTPNESLATEIALWVLEVQRTPPVQSFFEAHVEPALLGSQREPAIRSEPTL